MDIEKLNKMQIVLLTLLVSFVTSIATGIVTVTLLDQAPPAVTQTINRVVEKTIEIVVPAKSQTGTVVNEVIVIREENLIADLVEENEKSLVRINRNTPEGNFFAGFGFFVDKTGAILTSLNNISETEKYSIIYEDELLSLEILAVDTDKQLAYLKTADSENEIFKPIFKTIDIAEPESLRLGQTVIVLSGVKSTEVVTGIISGLLKDTIILDGTSETEGGMSKIEETYISNIKTNISTDSIVGGVALFNLKGEVIGINIDSSTNSFVPINFAKEKLVNILISQDEENIN